jgi:hypothetical protein
VLFIVILAIELHLELFLARDMLAQFEPLDGGAGEMEREYGDSDSDGPTWQAMLCAQGTGHIYHTQ